MDLKERIYKALENVNDPEIHKSLVELEMVGDIIIEGTKVIVNVTLTTAGCPLKSTIRNDVIKEVMKVDGVEEVDVVFGEMSKEQKEKLIQKLRGRKDKLETFKDVRVIAIGSGKGGVGKSTVTANLAVMMARLGARVGLIDADILGYSISKIMGISYSKPMVMEGGLLLPIQKEGVKVISMGNLVEKDDAFILRGPMLGRVLNQFLYDVYWGDLDYLLIDLPPGTGDVPLTLMQMLEKVEIVIVTTPQVTAAGVAKRLGLMASKTNTRVIGVIENMSYFICDNCGERHYIFGKGEGRKLSEELNVGLMGEIPLIGQTGEQGDRDVTMVGNNDSQLGMIYRDIAQKIMTLIN
ncbi:MAG: Mrp/NBP35 family ATP-binding protein [Bacillota bacterium]